MITVQIVAEPGKKLSKGSNPSRLPNVTCESYLPYERLHS